MKTTIKHLQTLVALGLLTAGTTAHANDTNFSALELITATDSYEFDTERLAANNFNGAFSEQQDDSVPDYVSKYSDNQSLVRNFFLPGGAADNDSF